jgi:hypothetical protein
MINIDNEHAGWAICVASQLIRQDQWFGTMTGSVSNIDAETYMCLFETNSGSKIESLSGGLF